jgi:hypothetical protein
VAPRAPRGADVEQDRAVEPPGEAERLRAPRLPGDRLPRGGAEVGALLAREPVFRFGRARGAAESDRSREQGGDERSTA